MKFNVKQSELESAIRRVISTVAQKTTVPVLGNILIDAGPGALTLTTFDLVARSIATVVADVKEPGRITVPAKGFAGRISNLEDSVNVTESSGKLTLKSGSRRYTIETLPADNFPDKADRGGDIVEFKVSGSSLGKLLSQVAYAADINPNKVNTHCVQLSSANGAIRAFAVDGHRFATAFLKCEAPAFDIAIQQLRARELARLLAGVDEDVAIQASRNLFGVTFPWGESSTTLPNAQVPQPDSLLSIKRKEFTCVAPREPLLQTIKALEVAAADDLALEMTLSAGTLGLRTNDGVDEVPVEYSGSEESVRVNTRYMTESLSASSDENVRLSLSSMNGEPVDAGIILLRPSVGEEWLAGIMPLRK